MPAAAARNDDHLRLSERLSLDVRARSGRDGSAPRSWRSCPTGGPCPIPAAARQAWPIAGLRSTAPTGAGEGDRSRPTGSTWARPTLSSIAESVDDLKRCVDWLRGGGRKLPGRSSRRPLRAGRRGGQARQPGPRAARAGRPRRGQRRASSASRTCPRAFIPAAGWPSCSTCSRELDRPGLALALDTGHAHISAELGDETLAAGDLLATTHVHDNDGRHDTHDRPGYGTIDWTAWASALDQVGYRGPIMLECIRQLRDDPALLPPRDRSPLSDRRRTGNRTDCSG